MNKFNKNVTKEIDQKEMLHLGDYFWNESNMIRICWEISLAKNIPIL